jgi:hypothetical protein
MLRAYVISSTGHNREVLNYSTLLLERDDVSESASNAPDIGMLGGSGYKMAGAKKHESVVSNRAFHALQWPQKLADDPCVDAMTVLCSHQDSIPER